MAQAFLAAQTSVQPVGSCLFPVTIDCSGQCIIDGLESIEVNGVIYPTLIVEQDGILYWLYISEEAFKDNCSCWENFIPTVTLLPYSDVFEGDAPFNLFGGSPVGGTYTGTCVTANVFDPSCVGAGNTVTITYTIIFGGNPYSASQPITVTGIAPVQQAIMTKIGWTFYDTNVPNLNDPVRLPFMVALGLQAFYYIRFPGSVNMTNAALVNTFIAATGAELGIYIAIPFGANPYDSFAVVDSLQATFNPVFWQLLQESTLNPYAPPAQNYIDYIGSNCSGDAPAMYHTATQFVTRWNAIATLTGMTMSRTYINLGQQLVFSSDNDANYLLMQNYFDVSLPADFAKFFVYMPNMTFINVINWLLEDASTFLVGTALEAWGMGKSVEWVLLHTANYNYLLRLGSFFIGNAPNTAYDAIERLVPLFKFGFVEAWDFGISGVTGLRVYNLDGTSAFLVNNNLATTETILAASVPGILTQFTRDTGYGATWGAAVTNQSGIVQTNMTVQPHSTTVATFSVTP